MEFKSNKFIHRSVTFCNSFTTSTLGNIHLIQIEHFISSDFLTCYKPERFTVEHVFFSFDGIDDCFSYYVISYKDSIVQFQLYFHHYLYVESFFHHYDDDYDLHSALHKVYCGNSYMFTFNDCLNQIYPYSSRESLDVLQPVAESEQRGLLEDELPS